MSSSTTISSSSHRTNSHSHDTSTLTLTSTPSPWPLDPIAEYRACEAIQIILTILLNRQLHRRWLLEQHAVQDPRYRTAQLYHPILHLEPIPSLTKPALFSSSSSPSSPSSHHHHHHHHHQPSPDLNTPSTEDPHLQKTLTTLKARIHILRARVEKGKELASEIERRMTIPKIRFPTHFCHTCVVDGQSGGGVEIFVMRCGHRVCRTCLMFGRDAHGVYECGLCFRRFFLGGHALVEGDGRERERERERREKERRAEDHSRRGLGWNGSVSGQRRAAASTSNILRKVTHRGERDWQVSGKEVVESKEVLMAPVS